MRIIKHQDILDLKVPGRECLRWVAEALREKSVAQLPPKISMKRDGNIFINVMPVVLERSGFYGVKVVSRYPQNAPALDSEIFLYDVNTGRLLALLDGNWITTYRTGAVAALSIKLLGKKDFRTIAMIGLGNTARATLDVLLDDQPDRDLTIKLKGYKGQETDFVERYQSYPNVKFVTCGDNKELICGSDVVVSCITYTDDLIGRDEWFAEGVLTVPIHTRGFQNCDLFFDKVVADDISHVAGFKYFNEFRSLVELGEVVVGTSQGRESDEQRILAYNIGIALQDVYFAARIYDLLEASSLLIDLTKPVGKFWV